MRYQGGKSRIAVPIANKILEYARDRGGIAFVSLFCGTCSIESKIAPWVDTLICNDKNEYLIQMLRYAQAGLELPSSITEEEWRFLREHKDLCKAIAGFAGFGSSFAGKFFGGYARDGEQKRSYASQAKRSLKKDIAPMGRAKFVNQDYRDVEIPKEAIIYADPPYCNTTGYGEKFDTAAFWRYMDELVERGHTVFVSELDAPSDWECIWQKPLRRNLDVNKNNNFMSTEKLFYKKGADNGRT